METANANYTAAKAVQTHLENELRDASNILKSIVGHSSGSCGLTPDSVKATPEWQIAKQRVNNAFQVMRNFNTKFASTFAKEIKADRRR